MPMLMADTDTVDSVDTVVDTVDTVADITANDQLIPMPKLPLMPALLLMLKLMLKLGDTGTVDMVDTVDTMVDTVVDITASDLPNLMPNPVLMLKLKPILKPILNPGATVTVDMVDTVDLVDIMVDTVVDITAKDQLMLNLKLMRTTDTTMDVLTDTVDITDMVAVDTTMVRFREIQSLEYAPKT